MANKSATDLVKEAKQQIENLTPQQVKEEMLNNNATLVDIRESEELLQNGRIPGAIHAPRGMLEFYADASLPYHKPEFDKKKRARGKGQAGKRAICSLLLANLPLALCLFCYPSAACSLLSSICFSCSFFSSSVSSSKSSPETDLNGFS